MEKDKTLVIGEKVELRLPEGEEITIFKVRVRKFVKQGIYLERPIIDRRHFRISAGDPVKVHYWRHDAAYRFESKILDLTVLEGRPVVMLAHPSSVERLQRRKHFRLDILLSMNFRTLDPVDGDQVEPEEKSGSVQNLSGGGIVFVAEAKDTLDIWKGSTVEVALNLTDGSAYTGIKTRVIRISADAFYKTRSIVVCSFVDVPEKVREAIIVHNIRYQQKWRSEKRSRE